MLDFFRQIQKGITLNSLIQIVNNFGLGFAAYYFKIQGVELYKIILTWAIGPLVALLIVRFNNIYDIKRFMRLGVLAYTGMALSLLFFNPFSFILLGACSGLTSAFFWVCFNYLFFIRSTNGNHAKNSSVYFILGPLIGVVMPPLGALVINGFGYRVLFSLTGLLTFLPLLYIRGKYFDHRFDTSWQKTDQNFSGFRLITFFNGASHYFQGNFLAIYAVLFLHTEYQVGGLLSYLALVSLAASFILAHVSDKSQKRVEILYPLLITMSGLILITPALSLQLLIPVIGLYAALDNLSLPIRFAVPMDYVKLDIGFWRASEYYCNLGRTVVFGGASLLLYMGNKWSAFFIFATLTFLFPFVINRKINWLRTSNKQIAAKRLATELKV